MFSRGYSRDIQFDNGYGASIVCHDGSYGGKQGLFEIAVLDSQGNILKDNPLGGADSVIGWLDFANVVDVLNQIKMLPKAGTAGVLTSSWMEAHGCKSGQMRGTGHIVHNGGWYNAAGEKIGWGDLEESDLKRLSDEMPRRGVLFILGEQDSFWKFVTYNPGIIGDLCETHPSEKLPGMDYILDKATIVVLPYAWYYVDRWGYGSTSNRYNWLDSEKMKQMVAPLLCQPETA